LGKDTGHLSKLVGENIKVNARVNLWDARSSGFSASEKTGSGEKRPGESNRDVREEKVKGPKAQGKEKRVRGPGAQRRKQNSY
jgi:hypothetical protein